MTKRLTLTALFSAIALIVFMLENVCPPLFPFAPGVKLGLANAVVFAALILLGYYEALGVLLVKCVLGSVFGGNLFAIVYALSGGIASFAVTAILYRFVFPHVGIVGISLVSAVVFNTVQLAVACAIAGVNLMGLLPLMLVASLAAGTVVGFAVWLTVKKLPRRFSI